jgi:hypothetical protein
MSDLIPISEALKHTKYSHDHIRYLIKHNLVIGKKFGHIWAVDLESLLKYEKQMNQVGKAKHRPKSLDKE